MAWKGIKGMFSGEPEQPRSEDVFPVRATGAGKRATSPEAMRMSLDAIGQRDEVIRQRIGVMIDRLDDVSSLQADFAEILEPLISISDELPRATMRISELELALNQERQTLGRLRQESSDTTQKIAELGSSVSSATSRAEQAEAQLREALTSLEEYQESIQAKVVAIENLERQLFAETEQKTALIGESKALRSEAQTSDAALARAETELREVLERAGVLEQEIRRLQLFSEEQAVQLEDLRARYDDLEGTSSDERQRLRVAEAALATETSERERIQTQFEADASNHRTDRAGLLVKLDAATARANSTEQLVTQAHRQLRERDEVSRANERTIKEALIARTTAERRVEALQADIDRQRERFLDMQRLRTDLSARCDMLTKAMAAKDSSIDQVNARNAALADRIEQLNSRHEAVRSELETTNRRLAEDLENERSERMLAQGALDMARETRAALQKQHDTLKRASRGWRDIARPVDTEGSEAGDGGSNVRPFQTPIKS